MYTEEKIGQLCRIVVVCDTKRKGHVETTADVTTPSHESSVGFLYTMGWRLHRGKQLCPECAARVANRMAKREVRHDH